MSQVLYPPHNIMQHNKKKFGWSAGLVMVGLITGCHIQVLGGKSSLI